MWYNIDLSKEVKPMSNDKNENNKIRRRQVSSSSSRPNTNTNRTRPSTSQKNLIKKTNLNF